MAETGYYRLRQCVWEITLACCFSCSHCGSRAGKAREGELDTKECLEVSEQLSELGCRRVSLIGGEVFMRPDWAVIAGSLISKGISTCIITNGLLLGEEQAAAIKRMGAESVAVSIDGNREVHDLYRQKGSFDAALKAIDLLSEFRIPVSVITTLNGTNVKCLEELFGILKTKDIFAWQLQACSPMGNAGEGVFDSRFDFRSVIGFVYEHRGKCAFALGIADNIGYYTEEEGLLRGNVTGKSYYGGCSAGISGLGIDSVGNVRGCEALYDDSFIEGNLRERSLAEIWNDPGAFSYNRNFSTDMLTGGCRGCEYGERCRGGCRSYNYFAGGDLYGFPSCARFSIDRQGCL